MSHRTTDSEWEALGRYLAGESAPEEAAQVERWLAQDQDRAALRALDRAIRLGTARTEAPVDVEAALRKVKARFQEAAVIPLRRPFFRWQGMGLAAALLLVAGAALLWRLRSAGGPAPARPAAHYRTLAGATASIPLPDGSRILLGPGSELEVAAGYGDATRRVALRGQAFFTVSHDPAHPFVVRVAGVDITDLGTSFSVSSAAGEVEVSVVTDSVAVQDTAKAGPAVRLRAGTVGLLQGGQRVAQRPLRQEDDLAWTRGRLIFANAPLPRVQEELRRWYGLTLLLADSALAQRHLSAAFAGESREQVLNAIALALGLGLERRGDTAILRNRKPAPAP